MLDLCVDGQWQTTACMAERGQLCEAGACVDPWRYGSPSWSTCEDEPRAVAQSLADKAAGYDEIARRLHVHPDLKWAQGVVLKPGKDEATATWQDVERFKSGENDGLWSALFMASQAYRYAVTKDPAALEMLRILMEGEQVRMDITGVPGMFTRQFIPPGVDGIACPADEAAYTRDVEKDDNQWVEVRDDGCVWFIDDQTQAWTKSEHCGLDAFAGYCWLDNVSKDEYAGHMFALGAVYKLVDDPEIRGAAQAMLHSVGKMMVENDLKVVDWDGRVTEHGRFHPLALDNFPGHNAGMSLGYLKLAVVASEDPELSRVYDECLLMTAGRMDCFDTGLLEILPFAQYLSDPGIYLGDDGCKSNFNNISMHTLSMLDLIWYETDPVRRARYQRSLEQDVMKKDGQPRTALEQNNTWFDFIWAAHKALGPGTDGPAYEAVDNGICMLRQFPASKAVVSVDVDPTLNAPYCTDRFGRDSGQHAKEVADRCITNFVWWKDPYDIRECGAQARTVEIPTDYLLAYWMGRYFGFISADM